MALIDRIKFDAPPCVLVARWPSDEIVLGSQLIVNESQEALFFKGGQALDLFGPGTHTLASGNLPLLRKLIDLPFGGRTPFAAEIYFINKAVALSRDWGTRTPILLLDPRFAVTIPLRAYGQYAVRVENSREFILRVVGTSGGATADTAGNIVDSPILTCVQQTFGEYLIEKKVSALDLPQHTLELAGRVLGLLRSQYKTFGIELLNFTVESINFDPKDESVCRLRGMLDEAARLDVLGNAYRRNPDFYRLSRQFDVLEGAASRGEAGSILGAAMGVGMGFGLAGSAAQAVKEALPAAAPARSTCADATGTGTANACAECRTQNPAGAKFCASCGKPLGARRCAKCGADLQPSAKFCSQCGEKT